MQPYNTAFNSQENLGCPLSLIVQPFILSASSEDRLKLLIPTWVTQVQVHFGLYSTHQLHQPPPAGILQKNYYTICNHSVW